MLRVCSITVAVFLSTVVNSKCDNAASVIIVGAGSAGIAAAAKLLENNFTDVTILEAEGRIGGRIYSVKFGGTVIDLGAQWCHGEKDNIVYNLVKDYDLLELSEGSMTFYHSSNKLINENLKDELFNIAYKLYENPKPESEISIGEYIIKRYNESITTLYGDDQEKITFAFEFLDLLSKLVLSIDGAFSWFDISAKNDYVQCEGNQGLNWKGRGYKTVLDVLMKKYPNPKQQLPINEKILLNKEVTKIIWDDSTKNLQKATVVCSDGSVYNANHVIFTPSLGVLKYNHRTLFDPPLPEEKINAINELGFGAVGKAFLHFPERWWAAEGFDNFYFIWSEKDKQLLLNEFPDGPTQNGISWLTDLSSVSMVAENLNALEAWFTGEFVPKIELLSDEMVTDGVMFILKKFLKDRFDNITQPDSMIRNNWYTNAHFRGTYSYQTVIFRKGGVSREDVLSQPLIASSGKHTLLFAGEATHPIHYSTVHGAIETGQREAETIINLYK